MIPIGLPDDAARLAIWQRYVPEQVADVVDLPLLVDAHGGLLARRHRVRGAQRLAAGVRDGGRGPAATLAGDAGDRPLGPRTDDYLDAIANTRTTVSSETAAAFLEDIEALARV